MTSLTHVDENRFHTLLSTWNRHQELRRAGAPIPTLAASRTQLDSARLCMYLSA